MTTDTHADHITSIASAIRQRDLPIPSPKAIVAVIRMGALQTVVATKNAADVRVYLVDLDNLEAEKEEIGLAPLLDPEAANILESGVTIW